MAANARPQQVGEVRARLEDAARLARIAATDLGHDLHPWKFNPWTKQAHTGCRSCGMPSDVGVTLGGADPYVTGPATMLECPGRRNDTCSR